MGVHMRMKRYAENCALCKFLHSKFWHYTSAGSIPYSPSLCINARRLMPSIKAVRAGFLLFQHFHNDAFFDAFNFLFKLRSPTGAVFASPALQTGLTNLRRKILSENDRA